MRRTKNQGQIELSEIREGMCGMPCGYEQNDAPTHSSSTLLAVLPGKRTLLYMV